MIVCYRYPFETLLKRLYDILETTTRVALEGSRLESVQPRSETNPLCLFFPMIFLFQFPHQ